MGRTTTRTKKGNSSSLSSVASSNTRSNDLNAARRALLSAVEDFGSTSPQPFLRLFVNNNSKNNNNNKSLSLRESQIDVLQQAVESFHAKQARRFFGGLQSMVATVLEQEDYIPLSAYAQQQQQQQQQHKEQDEHYNDDSNNDDDNDDDDEVLPDAKSSENLHFLRLVALVTQGYIEAQASAAAAAATTTTTSTSQQQHKKSTSTTTTTTTTTTIPVLEEVFQVATALHDILFVLNSCGPDAVLPQASIVAMCEAWWLSNMQWKEHLVAQALPLLVHRVAVGDNNNNTKKNNKNEAENIKRLYAMREAFTLIDFANPDCDTLKGMLMRLASYPTCLRLTEGKQFLAFLFQADAHLVPLLHQAIRVQLAADYYSSSSKKSILQAYGEIYYKAWKDAPEDDDDDDDDDDEKSGNENEHDDDASHENTSTQDETTTSIRKLIESHVLQDLFYAVIHVANPTLSKSLLVVLKSFHDSAKTNADMEDLLYRLYSPILWRSLTAAHARVRLQAVTVLTQVFPLQPVPHTRTKEAMTQSCQALQTVLHDRDPRVREAASHAVAQILARFWNVVPTEWIRTLLNQLVAEHASDASSAVVRAGALQAVTLMLDACPESHGVLRPLLPNLGNLIHDKVETVRVAAVRLLLCIKKIPGIKYFHVVPFEHLTCRLAEEGRTSNPNNAVASGMTQLLLNSYFPSNKTALEQMRRNLRFLKTAAAAALVFYANLSQHLPVPAVADLATKLLKCLHSAVEQEQQQQQSKTQQGRGNKNKRRKFGKSSSRVDQEEEDNNNDEEDNKENDDNQDDANTNESQEASLLSAADTALMAAVAEAICILWQSIENKVDAECSQFLQEQFSGSVLTNALTHFEEKAAECVEEDDDDDDDDTKNEQIRNDCYRACASILRLAGRLPSKAVKGLVPHISSVLASLSDHDGPRPNVSAHIALLCLWGKTDEVAPSLASSIEADFEGVHEVLFASPDPVTKKRKSGRRKKSDGSLPAVPQLPPTVALDVLGDIFRGLDPSSVAAREAILFSPTACSAIERALERGIKHAERLLAGDSSFTQSIQDEDADFLLRVCELYGRFALHKQASTDSENKGLVAFNEQAEQLLHWTTYKVVPALVGSNEENAVPFNDPNISRISIEKSFDILPGSPIPTGPPKRRPNRNLTPTSARLSQESQVTDGNSVNQAFALSLMQSSCLIFSEWLAVGGSGAEMIDTAASGWCMIFKTKNNEDSHRENPTELQDALLPAFSRLAMQLCKTSHQFSLLKELLVHCVETEDKESTDAVRKTFSSLFLSRCTDSASAVTKAVECVLQAVNDHLDGVAPEELEYELPESMGQLWPHSKGMIAVALNAILGNKQASLAFGKLLVNTLPKIQTGESCVEARSLFYAKCLWILFDGTTSKVSGKVAALVRGIDTEIMGTEGQLRGIFDDLKDAVA